MILRIGVVSVIDVGIERWSPRVFVGRDSQPTGELMLAHSGAERMLLSLESKASNRSRHVPGLRQYSQSLCADAVAVTLLSHRFCTRKLSADVRAESIATTCEHCHGSMNTNVLGLRLNASQCVQIRALTHAKLKQHTCKPSHE